MNVSRNRGNTTESWNTMAYHQPDKFGFVHFGGDGDAGIEIREAWVNCTEGEWTVTADVVCPGTEPVEVVLQAEAGKDGEIIGRGQSEVVRVGSAPAVLQAPLEIQEKGAYDVMVKLSSVGGKELARGRAHGERKPLLERLFLFRTDFHEGEDVIRGYYRLTTLPQGRSLMAELALLEGGETLARGEIARLSSVEGQFGFTVPPLPEGTPTFQLRVKDNGGKTIAQMERKLRVRKFEPIARERIHFHVDEPAGVARNAWPITAGIPFGEGMLAVEDIESHSRVLDADGKELACQTRVVATWTDARRYARWVHFDFQGDIADLEHEVRVRIWASGHSDSAAATLLGPSGATISKKEFSTRDLPFATHGCVLTVTIPKDGVTGHYMLRLERLDGPYMRCWLTQAPEKRIVLVKGEEFELGAFWGTRFWFHVPQDCTGFRIGAKPWNRATRFGFAVYDGLGRFVDAKGWYYNSQIDKLPTHWLDINVPADTRGTWWSIPYTCAKGIHFIWPKELPPYLADSPTSGFLPDPEYLRLVAGKE